MMQILVQIHVHVQLHVCCVKMLISIMILYIHVHVGSIHDSTNKTNHKNNEAFVLTLPGKSLDVSDLVNK